MSEKPHESALLWPVLRNAHGTITQSVIITLLHKDIIIDEQLMHDISPWFNDSRNYKPLRKGASLGVSRLES